jgi:serine/threonine protein kinase
MPKNRPRIHSNSVRSSHDCIGTLRNMLAQNMKLEASHERKFISRDCLDQIWSNNDLRDYVLGLGIGDWSFIEGNLIKTLSILAWIHWDEWSQLAQIFASHTDSNNVPDRLDKDLPYEDNALLARTDFLSDSYFAGRFYEDQFIFLPVVLIENRDLEFPRDRRLPFVSESESMGTGSYGTVTKVVVAKGHFMNAQGNTGSWVCATYSLTVINAYLIGWNPQEKPLARKRLEFEPDFRKEVQNLRTLKRNQLRHQRIMQHCGSLIHGNNCNIFFEWSDFNAQDLLSERCDTRTCSDVTPRNLLWEASYLAGALWFLHHQLDDIFCCHMDLKPDNILVVQDDESPVGQWMITDFGISVFFKEPDRNKTNNEFLSVRELEENIRHQTTRTVPKRRPGPFQPPEVESIADAGKVGRKGDVWSFGCVLAMVLAFALGGRRLVEEFDRIRGSDDDETDYFYHFTSVSVGTRKAQIPEVKPGILRWLHALPQRFAEHSTWIPKCVDLIKETLTIEQTGRPESKDVKHILREICYEMDGMSPPNAVAESFSVPAPPNGRASPPRANSILAASPHSPRTSVGATSTHTPPSVRDVQMEASPNIDTHPLLNSSYRPFIDTASSLGEWQSMSLRRKTESDSISLTRHGQDSRQSSLNYDERRPDQTYFDLMPLEFQSSPPPLDPDLSEIESNDHPPSTPVNISRRSTRVSISHAPNVSSVGLKFRVPPNTGLQPVICPSGNRIVLLSKKCAFIYSLQDQGQRSVEEPSVKIEGIWRRASLAGQFVALMGENNQVVCLFALIFLDTIRISSRY